MQVEKPPRVVTKNDIEALLFRIQTLLRSANRQPCVDLPLFVNSDVFVNMVMPALTLGIDGFVLLHFLVRSDARAHICVCNQHAPGLRYRPEVTLQQVGVAWRGLEEAETRFAHALREELRRLEQIDKLA